MNTEPFPPYLIFLDFSCMWGFAKLSLMRYGLLYIALGSQLKSHFVLGALTPFFACFFSMDGLL